MQLGMDHLEAMRAFVTVADQGGFARAAQSLRRSPSAVTRQVAQLEDDLGVSLLTRTTRALSLTEPGRSYLESCRQILGDLDLAQRRARGEEAGPRGLLRLAAPILFGRLHVLPLVSQLLAQHPGLDVRLTLSDRNAPLVEEGLDAAVRVGVLADSSLKAVRLGTVTRAVLASPAYLAVRGRPVAPGDLAAHDLIAFEGGEATSEWRFADTAVRIAPRLSVNSADAAIAAAEAGLGIVRALSYQVREAVLAGRLVPVLAAFAPSPLPVSVVHPERRIASPNVVAFVAAARTWFRERDLSLPTA